MSERGTNYDRDDALAACASVLFREGPPTADGIAELMRRRDLAYSIDRHLELTGTALDPLTRALLAAAREAMCLEIEKATNPGAPSRRDKIPCENT